MENPFVRLPLGNPYQLYNHREEGEPLFMPAKLTINSLKPRTKADITAAI
jgi:hypothetical protein